MGIVEFSKTAEGVEDGAEIEWVGAVAAEAEGGEEAEGGGGVAGDGAEAVDCFGPVDGVGDWGLRGRGGTEGRRYGRDCGEIGRD